MPFSQLELLMSFISAKLQSETLLPSLNNLGVKNPNVRPRFSPQSLMRRLGVVRAQERSSWIKIPGL
jgi:hypothetical protein